MKNNILIYRDELLPPSETFILSQGEGLQNFNPFYVGTKKVKGIEIPRDRSFVVNNGSGVGRFQEAIFKAFGRAPAGLLKTMERMQPALIHAHFGPDGVLAQSLAKDAGLPLIVTFHGYDATTKDDFAKESFFIHRKYIRKRRDLINFGSKFIAVSEFIKSKIIEQGFPEDKIIVNYIGIDVNAFQPLSQIPRKPIILFVGRLVEKKGCTYLIRAMQIVQASLPDAELVVIGDGPLRSQLEGEAEKTLRKFLFLGVQPPDVVKEWMDQAKVFSVPSITAESGDAEGFGIVFAEAQAMGLPVVSFASGGIPEAVAHDETGFLSPERDWEGLAASILRLLANENLWQAMSIKGQRRVQERFDLKKQARLLEKIYDEVISNSIKIKSKE